VASADSPGRHVRYRTTPRRTRRCAVGADRRSCVDALAVISYTPLVRIHLGPLAVSRHGIGAALGLLVGSMLMQRAARQRGIDETLVNRLLTRAVVGGLLGARLFYVRNHPAEFASPLQALRVWEGGLILLGRHRRRCRRRAAAGHPEPAAGPAGAGRGGSRARPRHRGWPPRRPGDRRPSGPADELPAGPPLPRSPSSAGPSDRRAHPAPWSP
jgi:hypothetical protein